jgi:hypothetical protein
MSGLPRLGVFTTKNIQQPHRLTFLSIGQSEGNERLLPQE